jgi:hypothetical protein
MKKPNVFIIWSGDRSKLIAEAFYDWLPTVVQAVKPWLSSANIDKGSRGLMEMAKALDGIKVGVTFLTPENLDAPWILYEAGSLAKTVDDSTRLCTYLLGGLKNHDIKPPLGQFQHTSPEKEDTRHLIRTINKAVGEDEPLSDKRLDAAFDSLWPDLEKKLQSFPEAATHAPKRSPEDMLAEILEFTRSETNRREVYEEWRSLRNENAYLKSVLGRVDDDINTGGLRNLKTLRSLYKGISGLSGEPPVESEDEPDKKS